MSSGLPEIRIKDGWLLRENASVPLNELWGDGTPLLSDEKYAEIAEDYRKAWQLVERKILSAMTDLLGVSFKQNIIDVYIAPWFSAFSDPLVIGVIFKQDEFIDHLTHELLHRLLTDNEKISPELDLLQEWQRLFGDEHSFVTLIHIPVHATQKAIYLDVLKEPARLDQDIKKDKKHEAEDYLESWRYVDQNSYQEIVTKLKKFYAAL